MARLKPKAQVIGEQSFVEAVEALLAEPFALLDPAAYLAGVPEADRAAVIAEARREHWRRREAAREPELLTRLSISPPSQWGAIFAERPDLERRLSFAQRQQWRDWRAARVLPIAGKQQS